MADLRVAALPWHVPAARHGGRVRLAPARIRQADSDRRAASADSDWHRGVRHDHGHWYLLHLRDALSIPLQQGVLLEGDFHYDRRPQRRGLLRAYFPAIAGNSARQPASAGGAIRRRGVAACVDWGDV